MNWVSLGSHIKDYLTELGISSSLFFCTKEGVSIGGNKSIKIFVKGDINVPLIRLIYEYKKLEEKWS